MFVPFFERLPGDVTAAQHNFSTFTTYIISVLRDGRGRIVTENARRNSPRLTVLYAACERGSKLK
jgi:hypothetical protein